MQFEEFPSPKKNSKSGLQNILCADIYIHTIAVDPPKKF